VLERAPDRSRALLEESARSRNPPSAVAEDAHPGHRERLSTVTVSATASSKTRVRTVGVALGLASELLVDWAGQSRQYAAPDILSAFAVRLRRWLLKEKAARARGLELRSNPRRTSDRSLALLARLHSFRGSQYDRIARLTYARVSTRASHYVKWPPRTIRRRRRLQKELQHFAVRFLI